MNGRFRIIVVTLAAILVIPFAASAGPLGLTLGGLDGLFVTTTGKGLETGAVGIGGGFAYVSDSDVDYTSYSLPVTMIYGFSPEAVLGVSLPVITSFDLDAGPSESGMGDLLVSFKYSFRKEDTVYPSAAFGGRLKLATADENDGLGTGESDIGVFFAADKAFGGIQGMLNVEYLLVGSPEGVDLENQVNYAIGLKIPYSQTVYFGVELLDQWFITSDWIYGDLVLGSIHMDLGNNLQMGFAAGLGLNESSPDILVGAKVGMTL